MTTCDDGVTTGTAAHSIDGARRRSPALDGARTLGSYRDVLHPHHQADSDDSLGDGAGTATGGVGNKRGSTSPDEERYGVDRVARVAQLNRADSTLYAHAKQLFEARWKSMLAQLPDAERDVRFVPEDDPWGRHWNAGSGSGLYTSQVITSHWITLHYITLHHVTSHYITVHHIAVDLASTPRRSRSCSRSRRRRRGSSRFAPPSSRRRVVVRRRCCVTPSTKTDRRPWAR